MNRPDIDTYYILMSLLASTRGTCPRRQVGCVLVDNKRRVLSIGYNGTPPGFPHCSDAPCAGAKYKTGKGLDKCEATHAEQSALIACKDMNAIHSAYVTASPCIHCIKLLLQTGCQRIVFHEEYPAELSKKMWLEAGREWIHHPVEI